jgi:hypothetical protein
LNGIARVRTTEISFCLFITVVHLPNTIPEYRPHVAIIGGGLEGLTLGVACLHRQIPFPILERDTPFDEQSQGYYAFHALASPLARTDTSWPARVECFAVFRLLPEHFAGLWLALDAGGADDTFGMTYSTALGGRRSSGGLLFENKPVRDGTSAVRGHKGLVPSRHNKVLCRDHIR